MNNESNTPVAESGRPKDVTGRIETEIRTYDLLDSLNIPYMRFDHEAAFTIDACTVPTKSWDPYLQEPLPLQRPEDEILPSPDAWT